MSIKCYPYIGCLRCNKGIEVTPSLKRIIKIINERENYIPSPFGIGRLERYCLCCSHPLLLYGELQKDSQYFQCACGSHRFKVKSRFSLSIKKVLAKIL